VTGRKLFRAGLALAGVAALSAAALAAPAQATTKQTAVSCGMRVGSVTASGALRNNAVVGTPPFRGVPLTAYGVYQPGSVRIAAGFVSPLTLEARLAHGYLLQGDGLYAHSFAIDGTGELDPSVPNRIVRIGGGWSKFTSLEISDYRAGSTNRQTAYGLRSDGTLFRWRTGASWRSTGSATGFASVKSMALIGKTSTYDIFLANLSGGALYTIKIPTAAPMKPVVTKVRPSGWGGFEKLMASKCGSSGTLLLGIDKDGKAGYTYAVGHANGAATVIQSLGKVKIQILSGVTDAFPDPVDFRWGTPDLDPLTGG
jgi:hypothetical protein